VGEGLETMRLTMSCMTMINIILYLSSFISLALKIPAKPLFAQSIESGLDRMCIYVYESLGEGLPVVLD